MNKKSRIMFGIIFGIVLGLTYGVVSQWVNRAFLPDIPLFAPPPGRFVTMLLIGLSGAALGFLATWPEEFLLGVIISSVAGTLVSSLISLQSEAANAESVFTTSLVLFITFLPRIFFFLPAVLLVRWAVSNWEREIGFETFSFKKMLASVLLLVVVGVAIGMFSLYPTRTRQSLKDLNGLILEGRQAASFSELPKPLQGANGFLENSNTSYTMKLVAPVSIPISRASAGFDENEIDIEVRFTNGYRFGCVYTPLSSLPKCINY